MNWGVLTTNSCYIVTNTLVTPCYLVYPCHRQPRLHVYEMMHHLCKTERFCWLLLRCSFFQKESMVIHDTECSSWYQVSQNNTKLKIQTPSYYDFCWSIGWYFSWQMGRVLMFSVGQMCWKTTSSLPRGLNEPNTATNLEHGLKCEREIWADLDWNRVGVVRGVEQGMKDCDDFSQGHVHGLISCIVLGDCLSS